MLSDISVNLCTQLIPAKKSALTFPQKHPLLNLKKTLNLSTMLRNQHFPIWVSCLILQSLELKPHTVNDSLIEEQESEDEEGVDLDTVNYLIKSCGLSEQEAISASKKLTLKNKALADSVLALFRAQGFSDDQITIIVKRRPLVLRSHPDNTLLPKLEFFKSIGFKSGAADLGKLISNDPTFLIRSVDNQYVPSYNILKDILGSNELVYTAVRRSSWIMLANLSRTLVPNIEVLGEAGVPQSKINYLLVRHPSTMLVKHGQFIEAVIRVKEMGFDPTLVTFVYAVHLLSSTGRKKMWDQCYKTYMRLGWSSEEIISAFKKRPFIMNLSEEKICTVMDYLVNNMGWPASDIVKGPHLLKFSLENRIIPRCSVVQFLHSKGLLKTLPKLSTVLEASQVHFFERYVIRYADEVPEVLQLYEGKPEFLHK